MNWDIDLHSPRLSASIYFVVPGNMLNACVLLERVWHYSNAGANWRLAMEEAEKLKDSSTE